MALKQVEIRVAGKNTLVPAAEVCGRTVIARPGRVKLASIQDDIVAPGELVPDPEAFVAALKAKRIESGRADFFPASAGCHPKV